MGFKNIKEKKNLRIRIRVSKKGLRGIKNYQQRMKWIRKLFLQKGMDRKCYMGIKTQFQIYLKKKYQVN